LVNNPAYCGIIFIKEGCKTENKIMSKDWKEQKGNKKWPQVKVAVPEPKSHSLKVSPVIDISRSAASTQGHVSPIVSPESSNDEKVPGFTLPYTPTITKLEVLAMVEILQKEVVDIRADYNTKHDHLVDLIATQVELSLSTSQS
jgi:hypothetical protein